MSGCPVLSITDHDNVGALDEAIEWGKSFDMEVITGLELSVSLAEKDVHILAYFVDRRNQDLLDYLTFFRRERLKRAERIVQKLNTLSIPLRMEAVLQQAGIGSVGRPHVANALLDGGYVGSYHEAFDRYIGTGGPAFEKKYQLSPIDAFKMITAAGGLSFLAHPGKYLSEFDLSQLIKSGLDGIEVVHPAHDEKLMAYYRGLVNQVLSAGERRFGFPRRQEE